MVDISFGHQNRDCPCPFTHFGSISLVIQPDHRQILQQDFWRRLTAIEIPRLRRHHLRIHKTLPLIVLAHVVSSRGIERQIPLELRKGLCRLFIRPYARPERSASRRLEEEIRCRAFPFAEGVAADGVEGHFDVFSRDVVCWDFSRQRQRHGRLSCVELYHVSRGSYFAKTHRSLFSIRFMHGCLHRGRLCDYLEHSRVALRIVECNASAREDRSQQATL
ncbi:hypothetical protein MRB53_037166 [Persea americana]|nr:hypothetical protein MRB53_037166 [Persea americana]